VAIIFTAVVFSGVVASAKELAPDFSIDDIDGNTFSLSDHRGKVVMMDFMKTTCTYCIQMMDQLVALRENYSEEELVIISISIGEGDTLDDIRDFMLAHNGTWTSAKDEQDLQATYDIHATPTEYFVDVNGCISSKIVGIKEYSVLAAEVDAAKTGCEPPVVPPVVIEQPAYNFTIGDIDGNDFTLSEHEGRVVLIDFFNPSGLTSVLNQEELKAVRENFTVDELVIISIGVEAETIQEVVDFRESHGGEWIYARDSQDLWMEYGVTETPTVCVVDVDGQVQFHKAGFWESQDLADDIEDAKMGYKPPPDDSDADSISYLVYLALIIVFVTIAVILILWRLKRRE
jgi:peroxiredoxin